MCYILECLWYINGYAFLFCFFVAGMNIFVAFFVLLLLLAESTPPAASNIPLIGKYSQTYALHSLISDIDVQIHMPVNWISIAEG